MESSSKEKEEEEQIKRYENGCSYFGDLRTLLSAPSTQGRQAGQKQPDTHVKNARSKTLQIRQRKEALLKPRIFRFEEPEGKGEFQDSNADTLYVGHFTRGLFQGTGSLFLPEDLKLSW